MASDHGNRITDYTGILLVDCYHQSVSEGAVKTLKANKNDACLLHLPFCLRLRESKEGGGNDQVVFAIGNGQADQTGLHEICGALNCMHDAQAVFCVQGNVADSGEHANGNGGGVRENVAFSLTSRDRHCCVDLRKLLPIRRFTPTECARLQGMPDWWCADIPHSDTAEYKMWGNGMALPNALYVMEGIAAKSGEEESI